MKTARGFTLIELMIVVVIITILAAIAYPAYNDYVLRTRRAEGKTGIMEISGAMERCFTTDNTYVGCAPASPPVSDFYTFGTASTATTYTVTGTPKGAQTNDTECGTMTVNQTGQQTATGTLGADDCW